MIHTPRLELLKQQLEGVRLGVPPAFMFPLFLLLQLFLTGQSTAASNNATTHSAALHACDQLQSSLGSSIVQTTGEEYQTGATNAWNLEVCIYVGTVHTTHW
jgi:hypothetical protein